MKKKLVERTEPRKPSQEGWQTTVQQAENILILNLYRDRKLQARYCVNTDTYEYAALRGGIWRKEKLRGALGVELWGNCYCLGTMEIERMLHMSEKKKGMVRKALRAKGRWELEESIVYLIERREHEYNQEMAERKENNRLTRVHAVMDRVPELPEDLAGWIDQRKTGGQEYMFKNQETGLYGCSACGNVFEEKKIKARNGEVISCPHCRKVVKVIKRRKSLQLKVRFELIQPIDQEISVIRHFDSLIFCNGGRKTIRMEEAVRIILFKHSQKQSCDMYYNQYRSGYRNQYIRERECFDNKGNPANRRIQKEYLYDGGIREAFQGTAFQDWTEVFTQMASAGAEVDYNLLLCTRREKESLIRVMELLLKGRFFRMLTDVSEKIGTWSGQYEGGLNLAGGNIKEVFGLSDQQKINRIRDRDGGEKMLKWMKWSEKTQKNIKDHVLDWLLKYQVDPERGFWMEYLTPEQLMNYMERQKSESYQGKNIRAIITQYEDYMDMCRKLHKNLSDDMVKRPRELKRRHGEAVEEYRVRQDELTAETYSEKFKEAEAVLQNVREKLEYEGERYVILVPQRIVEIVKEGRALHHCAGATDRYFDRIKQQETYICFLRRREKPEEPYYTIEVEPGGTIRQHRGMYDEEPEIEQVKPFLKEWQQVIRGRMKKQDHDLAEVSRVKREANLEELREKKNTRVLKALEEDLMEAM